MAASDNNSAMDYPAHERTYEGFVDFAKAGSVACVNVLIALALVNMDHGILGLIFAFVMLITLTIGLMMRPKGYIVGVVQAVIGLAMMALMAG
ncbi:MAG: aa3-type cytochrome c oxidase subunit IV [Rhodobiaceae bacterium]|nr:aa3-type cytochrome c oxidase subunit IV [Rhodobiaceae bacterium]MCC0040959.1 aa3-type cytochrome c oxidase subunit IV [Rhodobiaceae bacterium]MCC0053286.1 aa3-type cytochrome c oxidase subunit IV [Rhodobiaceae bacterium]